MRTLKPKGIHVITKSMLRHIYDFSLRIINDFFQAPSFDFNDFDKEYDDDEVAIELRGIKSLLQRKVREQLMSRM